MGVETAARSTARPVGLDGRTACEAFQATAGAHPERPAIRTRGDEFTCTWGEYADRVRTIAAGLAAVGVERGDTVALMLSNRPEFHFTDAAVMHLGATPFSIYNTYTAEQIAHLLGTPAAGSRSRSRRTWTRCAPRAVRLGKWSGWWSWTASRRTERPLSRGWSVAATPASTSRPLGRRCSPTTY
jgi:hypothetical protein